MNSRTVAYNILRAELQKWREFKKRELGYLFMNVDDFFADTELTSKGPGHDSFDPLPTTQVDTEPIQLDETKVGPCPSEGVQMPDVVPESTVLEEPVHSMPLEVLAAVEIVESERCKHPISAPSSSNDEELSEISENTVFSTEHINVESPQSQKRRWRMSSEQSNRLNAFFAKNRKPSIIEKCELSRELKLDVERVHNWFCSKRSNAKALEKKKKIGRKSIESPRSRASPTTPETPQSTSTTPQQSASTSPLQSSFPTRQTTIYLDSLPNDGIQKRVKRHKISSKHNFILEQTFKTASSPSKEKTKELATKTGLSDTQIKKWFENRRYKEASDRKRR
ncbi:hypothetical protein QR680_018963 [Steinernema hermaphroditum]|uniref:Homeobox domain-containing protein n=1 Tax=Steinernema hermaphroditum TaxID=289476 RepID=A0AA39HLS4_9BILA|nr:hypothetical protein QR680_018963 [Steinernema hermaphroditum]